VSFTAITLCVASQCVFIVAIVYFVIDSVRKLLDTPSYFPTCFSSVQWFRRLNMRMVRTAILCVHFTHFFSKRA